MATIIDSLLVSLGFKVDSTSLQGFAKVAADAKNMAVGLAGAITGAVYGLEKMVRSTAESMGDIQDFSERVDMSAREVAAFGAVAAANDSSMEAMQGTISSINALLGQAAAGFPRATMMLGRFGLKAKDAHGQVKSFDQIFADVIEKMQGASTGKRLAMANALGIDPKLIPLLKDGVENFERLRDEALNNNPYANSDYENAERLDKSFQRAERSVGKLKKTIAVGLFPTVEGILKRFTAWVNNKENIAKIQQGVEKLTQVLGFLWDHVNVFIGGWLLLKSYGIGGEILGWASKLMKFGGSLKSAHAITELLGSAFGGLKNILTGGLIAAIGLVAEDLWTYYQGGESVTGWLVKKFPEGVDVAIGALGLLSAAFLAITTGSGPLGLFVVGLTGIVIAAREIRDAWNPLKQWFEELWDGLADKVRTFAKALSWPLWAVAKVTGHVDDIYGKDRGPGKPKDVGPFSTEDEFNAFNLIHNRRINPGTAGVLAASDYVGDVRTWGNPSSPVAVNQMTVGPTNITIQESKDPAATAREIDRIQSRRQQEARQQTRDAQGGHR